MAQGGKLLAVEHFFRMFQTSQCQQSPQSNLRSLPEHTAEKIGIRTDDPLKAGICQSPRLGSVKENALDRALEQGADHIKIKLTLPGSSHTEDRMIRQLYPPANVCIDRLDCATKVDELVHVLDTCFADPEGVRVREVAPQHRFRLHHVDQQTGGRSTCGEAVNETLQARNSQGKEGEIIGIRGMHQAESEITRARPLPENQRVAANVLPDMVEHHIEDKDDELRAHSAAPAERLSCEEGL